MANLPLPTPDPKTETAPQPENSAWWREIIIATKYLTRLRIPLSGLPHRDQITGSLTWFPLVGGMVGAFGGMTDSIGIALLHLPPGITSVLAVLSMMWITRGLHEEQLASYANRYSDHHDRHRRVGWLSEERPVRYGTIALTFAIILRVNTISNLDSVELVLASLIASSAWSHALMVVAAAWLRPLPSDPVADHFGQPSATRVLVALGMGAAIVLAVMMAGAPLAMLVSALTAAAVIFFGGRLMGGFNGPLLGALQQITDLAMLATLVAAQNFGD